MQVFDRVIAGLADDHDIQLLCILTLTKLVHFDPEETERRLDVLADAFRAILSVKPKDTAVKQELEKIREANRQVLLISTTIDSVFPSTSPGGSQERWADYYKWMEANRSSPLGFRA